MQINKIYSSIIFFVILTAGIYGYFENIAAMKGEEGINNALAYVEAHWQQGDVIYMTDDGPWINIMPYTSRPVYRMPECSEPIRGSLSPKTRQALGMQIAKLEDIPHRRAWVLAPFSPLHPACYYDQIAAMTSGAPVYVVDDSEWLYSAVWLLGVTP